MAAIFEAEWILVGSLWSSESRLLRMGKWHTRHFDTQWQIWFFFNNECKYFGCACIRGSMVSQQITLFSPQNAHKLS